MRRSTVVTLTILAAASGAAVYAFSGSDVDSTDYVVTDEAACMARYGSDAQADCDQTFRQARQQHLASAPHYATVEECRGATGGECETTPASRPTDKTLLTAGAVGAAVAVPVLAGVLVGRMMDNGAGRVTTPLYAGLPPGACPPPGQQPQPAGCTPRSSGSSSSSSGARFYYSGTSYAGTTGSAVSRGSSAAFTASPDMARTISTGSGSSAMGRVSTASVSRGGFGASARGYSSSS